MTTDCTFIKSTPVYWRVLRRIYGEGCSCSGLRVARLDYLRPLESVQRREGVDGERERQCGFLWSLPVLPWPASRRVPVADS